MQTRFYLHPLQINRYNQYSSHLQKMMKKLKLHLDKINSLREANQYELANRNNLLKAPLED